MRALVTGGAGFIGSHIVEALLLHGWEVTVLDDFSFGTRQNLTTVLQNKQLRLIDGNILNRETVAAALNGVDTIFHEAAIVNVMRSHEEPTLVNQVNVEGTLNLLNESRKTDVRRLVFASSCGIYGDVKQLPIKEDTLPAPTNPYAASKVASEQYCFAFHRAYGLEVVCLRYTNVYGPRSVGPYSGVMGKFAERLLSNQPPVIYGDGEQTRDFIFSTDVAEANLLAAEATSGIGAAINVGTGVTTSVNELARIMAEITHRPKIGVTRAEPRRGEIRFSQADTSLARRILNFEARIGLREGLAKFITWYTGQHVRS